MPVKKEGLQLQTTEEKVYKKTVSMKIRIEVYECSVPNLSIVLDWWLDNQIERLDLGTIDSWNEEEEVYKTEKRVEVVVDEQYCQ